MNQQTKAMNTRVLSKKKKLQTYMMIKWFKQSASH